VGGISDAAAAEELRSKGQELADRAEKLAEELSAKVRACI
jgi:hypothetical protein